MSHDYRLETYGLNQDELDRQIQVAAEQNRVNMRDPAQFVPGHRVQLATYRIAQYLHWHGGLARWFGRVASVSVTLPVVAVLVAWLRFGGQPAVDLVRALGYQCL